MDGGKLRDLRWPDFTDYRGAVQRFYGAAGYSLAWVQGRRATPQALAMIGLLKNAGRKGLDAQDYDGPRWDERLARLSQSNPPPSDADLARFDLTLTVTAMRYISDLSVGRVNPRHFRFGLDIKRNKYDLAEFLRQKVTDARNVDAALEVVEPPFPGYRRTIEALQTYIEIACQDHSAPLPVPKKTVDPGDTYSGVVSLANRLKVLGDLSANFEVTAGLTIYEGVLIDAVKHFQRRHGLEPDGRLGRETLDQLNTPLARRVEQLRLTLERWRWIPHEFPRAPVVVNIPEFRLRAFDGRAKQALTMKVIVGTAYRHETAVFANEITHVVFRPYWNVPLSIQRTELVPKTQHDRSYLARNNYEIVNTRGQPVSTGPVSDEILDQLRLGKLAIRQKPGPGNALGLVKFMFPNEHDIYLHGTPAPQLFSKARRDFSHGCIRVENPVALAAWVLRDEPGWDVARIRAAMNGEKPLQVNLNKPIPVLILYATSVVEPDGEVQFFKDIYGYDAALERVLAKGHPYPR